MPHEALSLFSVLLCLALLVLNLGGGLRQQPVRQSMLGLGGLLLLSLLLRPYWPPTPPASIQRVFPPFMGQPAGLQLGLQAQTWLPPRSPAHPPISWLAQTRGGRKVMHKPIVLFARPEQSPVRVKGLQRAFRERFGWPDVWQTPFEPRAIIAHSTEGEDEAHAFAIFNRNTEAQYLGGVWTHFAVDPAGQIYQYGPLNRVSKGQAGLNDIAVGIEIVGTASLWVDSGAEGGKQSRAGSIIRRWQKQDLRQLAATADLIQTLQQHYQIPLARVYSHEDLGKIRDRKGVFPDYPWLRRQIRDRVYLSLEPVRDKDGQPERWYSFLEPYDRQDPGRDVMAVLYRQLQPSSN
ncbi:MAG: N-acetylmuramoyl-L-alanine amidase [Candidatus Sericytochromatia bacterium]|nr:N-acetylmuramoyl-L-alanine amidase [Candidatus Sericytochromatia bacterium]